MENTDYFENINSFESEAVNCSHKNSFVATAIKSMEYHFLIKPAVVDQLEKQQNKKFYDYSQLQVPFKLQTAFSARAH